MGRTTGFEPAAFGTTIQRSNQLSYVRRKTRNPILTKYLSIVNRALLHKIRKTEVFKNFF